MPALQAGGGRIEREYGLGRMRTDLLLLWPMHRTDAKTQSEVGRAPPQQHQKVVIECKVLRRGIDRTVREGLEQTCAYMDRCGAGEGHLVVFDQIEGKPWSDKLFRREGKQRGVSITVWECRSTPGKRVAGIETHLRFVSIRNATR